MGKLKVKQSVVYLGDKQLLRDQRFAVDEDVALDGDAAQLLGVATEGEERSGAAQEEGEEWAGQAAPDTDAVKLEEADAAVEDGDAEAVEQELAAMAALGLPVSFTAGSGLSGESSGQRGGDAGGELQHAPADAVDGSVERVRCALDGWLQSYDTSTGSLFYHRQGTNESVWQLPPGVLCHHPLPADQLAWAAKHAASLAPAPPQQEDAVVALHGRTLQPCGTHIRFTEEDGAPASASGASPASRAECPHEKYWAQRYRFFSRFDQGCCITGDMWFSVTPEVIAIHQARRLSRLVHGGAAKVACKKRAAAAKLTVVIDAFSGCGGNAIAFARERAYVLACDLSPLRLAETQRNAGVYGVAQYLDCVAADWTSLAEAMARHCRVDLAHAVFLSPPWGGPAYAEADTFDLLRVPLAGGQSAKQLLCAALHLAPAASIFLPKNVHSRDVVQMVTDAGAEKAITEQALLNGKFKAVTVYASRKWDPRIFDVIV